MANEDLKHSGNNRDSAWKSTFGAIAFLAFLGLLSYLGYQIDKIEGRLEDRLAYQPPVAASIEAADNRPVYTIRHAHTIYVPVYSHIYAMGGTPVLLETTLSVRNTDPERAIIINSINYYDTKGNKIDEYLDGNLELGPLESTEVLVEKRDTRGGSGANFLVKWRADKPVHLPVVQTVMVGSEGDLDISFRSNGRPLTARINSTPGD